MAGGQDYEVGHEARKTKRSRAAVKKVVKRGRQQSEEATGPLMHAKMAKEWSEDEIGKLKGASAARASGPSSEAKPQ